MKRYDHTQSGLVIQGIIGVLILIEFGVALWLQAKDRNYAMAAAGSALVSAVVLSLFYSLRVKVDRDHIALRFGIGIIGTRYKCADVESAQVVQSCWYHGWGIRKIPNGWLFNVSGFDAVQLKLKSGKVRWIGTDEPDQLLKAIEENCGLSDS